jgi:hypothetical protein
VWYLCVFVSLLGDRAIGGERVSVCARLDTIGNRGEGWRVREGDAFADARSQCWFFFGRVSMDNFFLFWGLGMGEG